MKKTLMSMLAVLSASAFNNSTAWKTDENGALVLKDGNPVFVDSSGKEMVVDQSTISRLNGEAKNHRVAKEEAEQRLKAFEGVDPEVARKAIEIVGKIDAKKLIDAGEVDKVRQEIGGTFTTQLTEKDNTIKTLQQRLDNMAIEGVFAGSSFVREHIAVPADMFKDSFRQHFKVENGVVVAYDKAGNRLLSKEKAGEYATPEEALQLLVEAHPQKDAIVRAQPVSGSGSGGGGNGRPGTPKTIKRSEFEAMQPHQQAEIAKKAGAKEIQIVD